MTDRKFLFMRLATLLLINLTLITTITACSSTQKSPTDVLVSTFVATQMSTSTPTSTSINTPKPTDTPTSALTPSRTPTNTSVPTATPTPSSVFASTPTFAPEPDRVPLPELLGFTDEYIQELEKNGAQFQNSIETIVDGKRHTALLFQDYVETVLLVYRLENDSPLLLLDSRSDDLPGLWAIGHIHSVITEEEWRDLNRDGRPDLVVYYGYPGTAWVVRRQVHVWQIERSGEVVDLTAPIYEDYRLIPQYAIEDINDDGVLELWVGDYRGELYGSGHVLGVSSFKIYAWQGDRVYDVSDGFLDLYHEPIAKHREYVESTYGVEMDERTAEVVLTQAFGLLIDYENSGRRDEGWQAYWELTDPEHWSFSSPEASEIITTRRELHRVQYEAGEPFGR